MAPEQSMSDGELPLELEKDRCRDRDLLTPTDRVVWEATRRLSSTLTFEEDEDEDDMEEAAREAEVCHVYDRHLTPGYCARGQA